VIGFLTLVVVMAAGLAYLFRDRVMQVLGQGADEPSSAVVATRSDQEGGLSSTEVPPTLPDAPVGDRGPAVAPAPIVEARAAEQEPAGPSSLERGSFSVLERIEWRRERGGLVVELRADGVVGSGDYDILRLGETGSSRLLLRLRGVSQAYPQSSLQVRAAEIRQIRTGYHLRAEGNELHVVFDLASGQVRLTGVEDGSPILRLHFRAG
jgi:hypothetical protein